MTLERKIAGLFKLTDENWMKHANPWSVWTRYSVLPLIVLAFWSRISRIYATPGTIHEVHIN